MRARICRMLGGVVERMARVAPPRHRDLVRGMVAELETIRDPAEKARFALGAIWTIARLALGATLRTAVHAPGRLSVDGRPANRAHPGGFTMSKPTTRRLLSRLAVSFAVSAASLTTLLLGRMAVREVPRWSARGLVGGDIVEALVLSLPHTLALTVPMAVFVAVTWLFTRLGAEGVLASAGRERHGLRHLVLPVVGAAAVVATLSLVANTQLLPRANTQLVTVVTGAPAQATERTMTVGELRAAVRTARIDEGPRADARAAAYEVEIQKKFALAAACLFLALVGVATGIRFPDGGWKVVIGASAFAFGGYWLVLVAGESLADRQLIPPLVAMWSANAVLLAVVPLIVRRPRHPRSGGAELAIGG